uniref:Uncharacterized protein n=1 Tax=Rhizochromulina marina TaxID=1034831 RepID=A0A7S2WU06_9STRA|mmetsp:Transcript_3635/g.10607  ORF Transcript_3635/g.10607 Transcript_3635/m.10607 type:complete len:158 (+) Transcript_3635:300-773(+)
MRQLRNFHVNKAHCYDPNEENRLRQVIRAVGESRFHASVHALAHAFIQKQSKKGSGVRSFFAQQGGHGSPLKRPRGDVVARDSAALVAPSTGSEELVGFKDLHLQDQEEGGNLDPSVEEQQQQEGDEERVKKANPPMESTSFTSNPRNATTDLGGPS